MPIHQKANNPVKTILIISIGFLIVFFIFEYEWAVKVSVVVGFVGLISNYFAMIIDGIWRKLSILLSHFVPNILLIIIFYFIVFPVSVLSKIFRKKDFLLLKNPLQSNFIEKNKSFRKESFKKLW